MSGWGTDRGTARSSTKRRDAPTCSVERVTTLDAATDAMNEWRIHAFAELAPFTLPEGERMHSAGSLVGVASELRPEPDASWSIFNPPVANELVVRGADTSGRIRPRPRLATSPI